jgi:hypothetical protein
MSCHVCKRTGVRTCNSDEAEIKCTICGFCEREALREVIKSNE